MRNSKGCLIPVLFPIWVILCSIIGLILVPLAIIAYWINFTPFDSIKDLWLSFWEDMVGINFKKVGKGEGEDDWTN